MEQNNPSKDIQSKNTISVLSRVVNWLKNDPKNLLIIILSVFIIIVIAVNVLTRHNPLLGTWAGDSQVCVFQNSGVLRDGFTSNIYTYEYKTNKLTIKSPDGSIKEYSAVLNSDVLELTDTVNGTKTELTRISKDVDLSPETLTELLEENRNFIITGSWISDASYLQFDNLGGCNVNGTMYHYEFSGSAVVLESADKIIHYNCVFISEDRMKLTNADGKEDGSEYLKVSDDWSISVEEMAGYYKKFQ